MHTTSMLYLCFERLRFELSDALRALDKLMFARESIEDGSESQDLDDFCNGGFLGGKACCSEFECVIVLVLAISSAI